MRQKFPPTSKRRSRPAEKANRRSPHCWAFQSPRYRNTFRGGSCPLSRPLQSFARSWTVPPRIFWRPRPFKFPDRPLYIPCVFRPPNCSADIFCKKYPDAYIFHKKQRAETVCLGSPLIKKIRRTLWMVRWVDSVHRYPIVSNYLPLCKYFLIFFENILYFLTILKIIFE